MSRREENGGRGPVAGGVIGIDGKTRYFGWQSGSPPEGRDLWATLRTWDRGGKRSWRQIASVYGNDSPMICPECQSLLRLGLEWHAEEPVDRFWEEGDDEEEGREEEEEEGKEGREEE